MTNNNRENRGQSEDKEVRARDEQDRREEINKHSVDKSNITQSNVHAHPQTNDDNGVHERDAEFPQKGSYQGQYDNPGAQQDGRESTIQAEQGGNQDDDKYPNRDYKDDKSTSRQDFDTQGRYGQHNVQSNPQSRDLKHDQHEASTHEDVQNQQLSRQPETYKNDDERIAAEVHNSLAQQPDVDANNIQVDVINGEVMLTGMVVNSRVRLMVENIAGAIYGVKHVQSNLRSHDSGYESSREIHNGVTGQGQPAGQPGVSNNSK